MRGHLEHEPVVTCRNAFARQEEDGVDIARALLGPGYTGLAIRSDPGPVHPGRRRHLPRQVKPKRIAGRDHLVRHGQVEFDPKRRALRINQVQTGQFAALACEIRRSRLTGLDRAHAYGLQVVGRLAERRR